MCVDLKLFVCMPVDHVFMHILVNCPLRSEPLALPPFKGLQPVAIFKAKWGRVEGTFTWRSCWIPANCLLTPLAANRHRLMLWWYTKLVAYHTHPVQSRTWGPYSSRVFCPTGRPSPFKVGSNFPWCKTFLAESNQALKYWIGWDMCTPGIIIPLQRA